MYVQGGLGDVFEMWFETNKVLICTFIQVLLNLQYIYSGFIHVSVYYRYILLWVGEYSYLKYPVY